MLRVFKGRDFLTWIGEGWKPQFYFSQEESQRKREVKFRVFLLWLLEASMTTANKVFVSSLQFFNSHSPHEFCPCRTSSHFIFMQYCRFLLNGCFNVSLLEYLHQEGLACLFSVSENYAASFTVYHSLAIIEHTRYTSCIFQQSKSAREMN